MKSSYCLLLEKVLENERMWTYPTLQSLAERYGVPWHQGNTDHVVFKHPHGKHLTISTTRPLKNIQIIAFRRLLQQSMSPGEPCE